MKAFINKHQPTSATQVKQMRMVNKMKYDVSKIKLCTEERDSLVSCFKRIKDDENVSKTFN